MGVEEADERRAVRPRLVQDRIRDGSSPNTFGSSPHPSSQSSAPTRPPPPQRRLDVRKRAGNG